ncbi:MAG: DUF2085 domain-containing protein [Anaerolineales bacterium]|nr:DUF2085 domain-containing protein [Anaerolineales bacterium]
MQTNSQPSKFENIASWVVPIAAIAAVIAWFIIAPEGALGKLDAIGYAVCHRIVARSFQIGDRQLPLCARCTGEFYAAGLALLFQLIVSEKTASCPRAVSWRSYSHSSSPSVWMAPTLTCIFLNKPQAGWKISPTYIFPTRPYASSLAAAWALHSPPCFIPSSTRLSGANLTTARLSAGNSLGF